MPDTRPQASTPGHTPEPNDRDDAATILSQTGEAGSPGGGTLIGGDTPDAAAGAGTTAASPIDTGLRSAGDPVREAQARTTTPDAA